MRKHLSLVLATLCIAGSAYASDVVKNDEHKHVLRTDRATLCSTPTAKMRKECAEASREKPAPLKTL